MGHATGGGSAHRTTARDDRALALLSSLQDVVLVRDASGVLTYCSPSVFTALGYQPDELEGTAERDLIHTSDVDARDDLVSGSRSGGPPLPPIELRMHDRAGNWHWFEAIEINRLDDPGVNGIVTDARDVTAHKAENAELLERSLRDPLTGIPNRLALMERLEVAVSRAARSRDVVAVLFCDLDDFKLVNDNYGHEFADRVLVEIARRLDHLQRKSDTVARIGGDEFVIVCDGLHDLEESTTIAARIHAAIERPIVIDGRECVVTSSIGIATIDGGGGERIDAVALLRNADAAMYRAKRQGRAHWHRFDDALVQEATRRFEIESELAPALEHGEFVLHYQPIHELARHTIVGVEAFLRWEHPVRGFLEPGQFLEIAEQTGVIVPIGAWAMKAACVQARQWRDAGWPGWMSVNLSGRELAEPGLAETVAAMLYETGVAPDRLWLELTESVFMRATRAATNELTDLQGLGVHIGVDDFGTGHTPLPKLQQLPTDFLKIDGGLVANLTANGEIHPAGCDMVAALVQVGTTLGLSVIAEGIESEIETELLVECGCQYGQGELLARPSAAPNPNARLGPRR
ncbi:MAG TPA: EAL domain-containing protein [Acidimicrobiia bacterium]|nr:EAL domain-containing protein [Acidimicrobiia bacterium]